MRPNYEFAKTVLDSVAENYAFISNSENPNGRNEKLNSLVSSFENEENSGIVTVLTYSEIFSIYKDKVVPGQEISNAEFDIFYDFYVDFVLDLKAILEKGKQIVTYTSTIGIPRSKSPSIEAYEYVGHNNLTFNSRRR